MLLLREYAIDEVDKIRKILNKEGIEDLALDGIVYVVIEDDDLVGVSKTKKKYEKWVLEYLVIREDNRNQGLGDALLRSIFNKLLNQGVENIYVNTNDTYLIKKGFALSDNECLLKLNIADFFSKGCNSCGGCNEL